MCNFQVTPVLENDNLACEHYVPPKFNFVTQTINLRFWPPVLVSLKLQKQLCVTQKLLSLGEGHMQLNKIMNNPEVRQTSQSFSFSIMCIKGRVKQYLNNSTEKTSVFNICK